MIISNSQNFIFIHLHKCGGTTVERLYEDHMKWNDIILSGSPFSLQFNKAYGEKFGLTKHSPAEHIRNAIGDQTFRQMTKIALIRHPVGRTVSLYNWITASLRWQAEKHNMTVEAFGRLRDEGSSMPEILRWPSAVAALQSENFSEFIRNPHLRNGPGFEPLHTRLFVDGRNSLDLTIKLEELEQRKPELLSAMGLNRDMDLGWANKSPRKLEEMNATKEDRDFLLDYFESDLKFFDYDETDRVRAETG